MKRSTDRILTTHSGSLIRTKPIIEGMKAGTLGKPYDEKQLAEDVREGIRDVVKKQVEAGIDIPNDGEYARRGFTIYIHERLGGLERRELKEGQKNPLDQAGHQLEREQFPGFFEQYDKVYRFMWMLPGVDMSEMQTRRARSEIFALTGPITYKGHATVKRDIDTLKDAVKSQNLKVSDIFITAVTPTTERRDQGILDFYPNMQEYQYALADALNAEYKAITDAGFIVQLDRAAQNPVLHLPLNEVVKEMEKSIELVNHALRGIPEEQVRVHWCGGSGNRPHMQDLPLTLIAPVMLKIKAQAYGIEAATPRHEHEVEIWKDLKLPDGKILVPGLVSQSTNVIEHPDLIAWRIKNFARYVGKENIIAGVDCGFSQDWDLVRVNLAVQWEKLKALGQGAAIASKQLWKN